jgi:putative endonuclease
VASLASPSALTVARDLVALWVSGAIAARCDGGELALENGGFDLAAGHGGRRRRTATSQPTGGGRWTPGPGENPGMPWVYLLRCADGSLYCGWTTDVQRRLVAHRKGTASRYTRSRRPVELAAIIPVVDRCAALREETRIKRLPRSAKLQLTDRRVDSG